MATTAHAPGQQAHPASIPARRFQLRHREYVKRRIGNQAMAGRRRMNAVPEQVAVRIAADGGTVEACVGDDIAGPAATGLATMPLNSAKVSSVRMLLPASAPLQTADRAVEVAVEDHRARSCCSNRTVNPEPPASARGSAGSSPGSCGPLPDKVPGSLRNAAQRRTDAHRVGA